MTSMRAAVLAATMLSASWGAAAEQIMTVDPVPSVSTVYALTHARLVVRPGEVLEDSVLLIRDGVIVSVGAKTKIPSDARVLDLQGRTVFAGFIDANSDYGQKDIVAPQEPVLAELRGLTIDMSALMKPDPVAADGLRKLGFTSVVSQPRHGVFRGGAMVLTTEDAARLSEVVVAGQVAQSIAFEINPKASEVYPVSPFGSSALIRQTLLDAQWQIDYTAWQKKHRDASAWTSRPELSALEPLLAGRVPVIVQATSDLDFSRAWQLGNEFKLKWLVNGNGYEYRYVQQLKAHQARLIVPLTWPEAPVVANEDQALDVALADLEHWEWAPFNARVLAEAGVPFALTANGLKQPAKEFWSRVRLAVARGLDEQAALAALTEVPARMFGVDGSLGSLKAGRRAQFVVADASLFRSDSARIHEVWVDGHRHVLGDAAAAQAAGAPSAPEPPLPGVLRFPAGEYGRTSLPEQPQAVIVRGATVWTQGPQGRVSNADVLIERGRIKAVGQGLKAPSTATVIDGTGLHVTPGIIDSHSHIAQNRGSVYGEGSDSITAEVSTQDALNPVDMSIYRQLSDGVTAVLLLQGSANPINGQSQAIKLRWGSDAEGLKIAGAPPSMKLALGENAKQSNWGMGKRYPLTRMGVEASVRESFVQARAYAVRMANAKGVPQRRDLRLEAVNEILSGHSTMHVHSYTQSELLAFMRLCREYGVKPVFHHISEGYKVADEMAAMGAGASAFLDYWGYKMESDDATTYNAAMMTKRGVVVSLSSDTTGSGSVPRLNLDAGYTVGFGGLTETQALDLVTINPAKQMGVAGRIGSLEPGKDADFVIWSDNPLSPRAIALQTWIEGRRYFDRDSDHQERARIESERARLIALVRQGSRATKVAP